MSTAPVLAVHLVFHPNSADARQLATAVDHALNGRDPVSGLRSDETPHIAIPTFFLPEPTDRRGLPPRPPKGVAAEAWPSKLWFAERNLVVVLSDEHLAAPPVEGEGDPEHDWSEWVHHYAPSPAAEDRTRLLPVMLTNEGWPLHSSLATTSFARLVGEPGDPTRTRRLVRRVVQELCRLLRGEERAGGEAPAPVDLFLSHAKADLDTPPRVLSALLGVLGADQPVRAWVDSGKIEPGGDFGRRILAAVDRHTVVCILTDHYSGRPWCRTEARVAKEKGRPMIVIDALRSQDLRSSPYLGNVPTLGWSAPEDDEVARRELASRAVDLAVIETLRRMHAELEVEQLRCALGDLSTPTTALSAAPEPLTVLNAREGAILHPDPPLSDDDAELFKGRWALHTPSGRYLRDRTCLDGVLVGVSVSESPDLHRFGLSARAMDDAYLELTRALLLSGAGVGYGGHFGKAGYTLALFDMVQAYRDQHRKKIQRVVSWLGWPNRADPKVTARYKGVVEFRRLLRPDAPELSGLDPAGLTPPPRDLDELYGWAAGMTAMRERMVREADVRLLLGGKVTGSGPHPWYSSRMPGVVEEAWLTLRASKEAVAQGRRPKPLFLVGAWGGATWLVGELLRGKCPREATWECHKRSPMAAELHERLNPGGPTLWKQVVEELQAAGIAGCANGLTKAENDELFECRYVPRIVELVVTGLVRWRAGG